MSGSGDDADEVRRDFEEAVNMTPKELREWLETDESQSVGQKSSGDDESTGHHMGREILALKDKNKDELDDDDLAAMKKVHGYVDRHLAQGGPKDDAEHSRWRYSLMNWGHDPLK